MASSTKMTLTLTFNESQAIAQVLQDSRSSALHTASHRMRTIQKEQQAPFSEIPKPPASTLDYNTPNYYEWEELYKALKKIEVTNMILAEFGFKAEYPEVEAFVPVESEDA
jgi:hypothetical protein